MADTPAADPNPSPAATPVVADPAVATPAVADPSITDPSKVADPAKAAEPAKPVIPEKYDFAALKLPDGVVLNPAIIDAVSPVFKELGITQEGASKLIEAHAKAAGEQFKADEAKRESDFTAWMAKNVTDWQAAVRNEWGVNYDANLAIAQRGLARVFSAEGKALLDQYGLGNHPEFVKAFYTVGKMVSEDMPNVGAPTNSTDASARLYPTMNA